jgi:thymidylate synthase (FAD)
MEGMMVYQKLTKRPTSDFMEEQLHVEHKVLDHGHVILVDYLGDELAIIDNARLSYRREAGDELKSGDIALLRYLLRHSHTTPFESCVIKIRAKMPIFVARQWIRHRMASLNEQSARYSKLDEEFYIPSDENMLAQSASNKQGRDGELTDDQKKAVRLLLTEDGQRAYEHYGIMLGEGSTGPLDTWDPAKDLNNDDTFPGLARELARMGLTLNFYTSWIWKTDVHNLMRFLSLRCDHHAQYEIRVYADTIYNIFKGWMPNVAKAFDDYDERRNAIKLSGPEWAVVKKWLTISISSFALGTELENIESISKREREDLLQKIYWE